MIGGPEWSNEEPPYAYYISLNLRGDGLEPDTISRQLQLTPTVTKRPGAHESSIGVWSYGLYGETLLSAWRIINGVFSAKRDLLAQLAQDDEIYWELAVFYQTWLAPNPEILLHTSVCNGLAEWPFHFYINAYPCK